MQLWARPGADGPPLTEFLLSWEKPFVSQTALLLMVKGADTFQGDSSLDKGSFLCSFPLLGHSGCALCSSQLFPFQPESPADYCEIAYLHNTYLRRVAVWRQNGICLYAEHGAVPGT